VIRGWWSCSVLAFALGCGGDQPPGSPVCTPADSFLCGSPRNIAHRGGAALAPEETMPAYQNAVAIGADILEMDVRRTADGVLVLLHDATVDRTTDGVGPVDALAFAELALLDAGYRFTPDNGATYPFRGMGVRVPALADVLAAFPDRHFMIEIKDSVYTVGLLLALVEQHGAGERVMIAAFDDDILADGRVRAPGTLTAMGLGEMAAFDALTDADEAAYLAPAPIIQPPRDMVTAENIARAKRIGLIVHPWTVNDPTEMTGLFASGVDGIITDDPVALRDVIGQL
jgi:glycerophosphoryl diester phosphodiesterase